jgi:hypothetical protein
MSSVKKNSLPKRRGINLSIDKPDSSPAKLERQNDVNLEPINMADSFLLPKLEHQDTINHDPEAFAYSLTQQPPVNPFTDAFQQATQELHPFDLPYTIMPDTTVRYHYLCISFALSESILCTFAGEEYGGRRIGG